MLHCLVTEPRRKDLIITNDQGMQIAESIWLKNIQFYSTTLGETAENESLIIKH
jgi:hypothetical protein